MKTIRVKRTVRLYSGKMLEAGKTLTAQRARDARGNLWYIVGHDLLPARDVA